jgi:hypothetical protein
MLFFPHSSALPSYDKDEVEKDIDGVEGWLKKEEL